MLHQVAARLPVKGEMMSGRPLYSDKEPQPTIEGGGGGQGRVQDFGKGVQLLSNSTHFFNEGAN